MRLVGWNEIPRGYGARFEISAAPVWLRLLYGAPFLDRFAYPLLVRRGLGFLVQQPGWQKEDRDVVDGGWRLDTEAHPPGSIAELRETRDG